MKALPICRSCIRLLVSFILATTKGKRADRFPVATDKKKAVPNKDQRQMKRRVEWMQKRKKEGKNYSAKNLSELTAKLKKANVL